jgi:hypothetical protein
MVDGKGVVAFPGDDEGGKAQCIQLLSERFSDEPGISGEGNRGDIDCLAPTLFFELGAHGEELARLIGIAPPLFRAEEEVDRQSSVIDRQNTTS